MNYPFSLYELEEKIMDCWSITNDMEVLYNAIQEKEMNTDRIANILLGLEFLYELKFEYLNDKYQKLFDDKSLVYPKVVNVLKEKIMDCWSIVKDIKGLNQDVQDIGISNDNIAKILLNLKDVYNFKFNELLEHFSLFHTN